MVGLGDLPGGAFSSVACGVSSDGSVVVGWSRTAAGNTAFIWDATRGMRDLRFVLADDFNVDPNGWVLETARGISADGSMIIGQGKNPAGDTEAWLVDLNAVPKPVLSVPADITIECGTSTNPANTGIATASGTCSAGVTVSVVDQVSAGDCGAEVVITRTWTVADLCGNSVTDHQTITLRDTTAPTLVVPADRILACGETTEPTNTGVPTVTDVCGGKVTITFSDAVAAGACGGVSVITRTWTVTDACGNSASLDQTLTVEQPTTPVVTGLEPPPDWVVNRASSIQQIVVRFDRPTTVDSFAIRGVNTGPVAGVLTGNGTDTHTLVLETPLPNGDRYTAVVIANQVLAEWSFAVLIGDCDRNERLDIFDLVRMRSALKNNLFDEGCDIREDGVINIFDLGQFRSALQEGIALP